MNVITRVLTISALLAMTGFCIYGFLATFEPGDFMVWRIGYAAVGTLSLIGALITGATWFRSSQTGAGA